MGVYIGRTSSKRSVRQLIETLRPYNTDKNLIRLGPNYDGGYLVPDDLEGIDACFSPGVGTLGVSTGFDEACVDLGMRAYLADKAITGTGSESGNYHFTKKFVGATSGSDCMTLDEWINSALPNTKSDLLMQMDIEGDEYLTFLGASDAVLRRFRIIVVEFHWLNRLWNKEFFQIASVTFGKLLKQHTCVHIHPNNYAGVSKHRGIEIPEVAEFTFFRNDRISKKSDETSFPNPLDFDNSSNRQSIHLPQYWYR